MQDGRYNRKSLWTRGVWFVRRARPYRRRGSDCGDRPGYRLWSSHRESHHNGSARMAGKIRMQRKRSLYGALWSVLLWRADRLWNCHTLHNSKDKSGRSGRSGHREGYVLQSGTAYNGSVSGHLNIEGILPHSASAFFGSRFLPDVVDGHTIRSGQSSSAGMPSPESLW